MMFPDIAGDLRALAPGLRGRLVANAPIAETTWFRVGGPAQVLFSPADEDDLAGLLRALPLAIPVTAIGLGSNLIVRDGGVEGVVIRLGGRAFNAIDVMDDFRVIAGAPRRTSSSPRRRRPRASPASSSCVAFQGRSGAAFA